MIGAGSGAPEARARRRSATIAATEISKAGRPSHTGASMRRSPARASLLEAFGPGTRRRSARSELDSRTGRSWMPAGCSLRSGVVTEEPRAKAESRSAVAARCGVDGTAAAVAAARACKTEPTRRSPIGAACGRWVATVLATAIGAAGFAAGAPATGTDTAGAGTLAAGAAETGGGAGDGAGATGGMGDGAVGGAAGAGRKSNGST
jgi:hypothetical protein